jgi:hypothetical protein
MARRGFLLFAVYGTIFPSNIDRSGAERYFYSRPSSNAKDTLDAKLEPTRIAGSPPSLRSYAPYPSGVLKPLLLHTVSAALIQIAVMSFAIRSGCKGVSLRTSVVSSSRSTLAVSSLDNGRPRGSDITRKTH